MTRVLRLLSSAGVFFALLAALSLAAAGGAHRMDRVEPTRAAMVQALGPAAEICGLTGDETAALADCPVCHLVSAVVLPDPVVSPIGKALPVLAAVTLSRAQRAADTPLDRAHGTRAPPLV